MRKLHREKQPEGHKLDMVGVVGSIPSACTNLSELQPGQIVEIPTDIEVIPYLEWDEGKPQSRWLIRKKLPKSCKNSVNGTRRNKSA